jgi:NAD(P)-dependent dehydrogenase (short-subunit alcohol dehydrogenase family)
MSREFEHKIVAVTGGSRGIGRAIAQAFAREGAQVVIAASSPHNLLEAAEKIGKAGGPPAVTYAGDLKQAEKCEGLFELVHSRFGRCDVLVNCAGATRAGNFLELYDEEWHDGFALKFHAAVRLSRLFWPMHQYRRQRRSHAAADLPHRRRGQRGAHQFLEGPCRPWQARRRECQRHPSRHDRDRTFF